MKKLIMLGILDEEGYESDNRIYGRGGIQPKVIKKVSVIGGIGDMWGEQYRQQYRVIDSKQVSYALSAELQNVKVVRSAKKIR